MKALVINKPGELQVKDLSTPAIGADEVLVRMRAVGSATPTTSSIAANISSPSPIR